MPSLSDTTFVCFDCETTGLDLDRDEIIEIAIVTFTASGIISSFETLLKPDCLISEESKQIHHISEEMLEGKPKIRTLLPSIIEKIGKHIIVGHGIQFDIQMVAKAAERYEIPCLIHKNLSIDTLRMARIYGESPTNALDQLGKHFQVESDGAHRAMNDVKVNIEVFKKLAQSYKTTEQLLKVLAKPIKLKIMPLGKYKGREIKEIPLPYLQWMAGLDFDRDLLFSLRSEIKRRKQGQNFSQANNPFLHL